MSSASMPGHQPRASKLLTGHWPLKPSLPFLVQPGGADVTAVTVTIAVCCGWAAMDPDSTPPNREACLPRDLHALTPHPTVQEAPSMRRGLVLRAPGAGSPGSCPSQRLTCSLLLGQPLELFVEAVQGPQPVPVPAVSSLYPNPEDPGEKLFGR